MMKNLLTLTFLLIASFTFGQDSLGIVGSATPQGWPSDDFPIDLKMIEDMDNAGMYSINIDLVNGAAKFRLNNDWAVNWGGTTFPSGTATLNGFGNDIPVWGGNFDVTFDSTSLAYNFDFQDSIYNSVGLIGEAVGGWTDDDEIALTQVPGAPWVYKDTLELVAAECKFRADGAWGGAEWGDGGDGLVGVSTGGGNFTIPSAGPYIITLNTATNEYSIVSFIPIYESLEVIGEGSPTGAWGNQDGTAMVRNPTNVHEWSLQATFLDGGMKIREDSTWAVNWGGTDFPMGVGVPSGPDNIPVTAGDYLLVFNDTSLVYDFRDPLVIYSSMGITGDATVPGWASDTTPDIDMIPDPNQPDVWRTTLAFKGGNMKFRANDGWDINWGNASFPNGIASMGGSDIMGVPAGTWEVTFNSTTGEFVFNEVSVAIVGPGSPDGDWPVDGQTDLGVMSADSTLGGMYTGMHMLGADKVKFRQNNAWTINWGYGTIDTLVDNMATQDGTDITITEEGMYDLSLIVTQPHNPANGDVAGSYSIVAAMLDNTENIFTVNNVKLIPNPATDLVTVQLEGAEINGDVNVVIMDMTGKLMHQSTYDSFNNLTFNVSNFPMGTYVIQMYGEGFVIGKKLVVAK